MNLEQNMVRAFHIALGFAVPDTLAPEGFFPGEGRIALIEEEAREFADASRAGDLPAVVDAICDLLYVTYGVAVTLGVDVQPFFTEVHRTNMAKRGGPIRENVKQLKPVGWRPPDIAGLLAAYYDWRPPA